MANIRPAGMSDEDSDTDDDFGYGYEKPKRNWYQPVKVSERKKVEMNLQNAIINGSLDEVEKIIEYDLNNNVNDKMDTGWTPLMHACFHAQDKIVQYLISKGADPNLHSDSVIPVMLACSNSSASNDVIENIVNQLMDKGSILNIGDKYGQTPLMRAISSGRFTIVEKLLDKNVNIEMRDQKGWTAVFIAVHHNRPDILELLISRGARLTELDKNSRTLMDIAISQDHENVIQVLSKHLKSNDDDVDDGFVVNEIVSWHDFYPGTQKGFAPNYKSEIYHMLYGMNCERLLPLFKDMTLRQFLLLEEVDMHKLGITLPYQRQRLKSGLKNFHAKNWKLNAVSGLYAVKKEHYSVVDCLSTLGSHLQQIYILEATLQYIIRSYCRLQDQLKYEPPDSPFHVKMKVTSRKMLSTVNNLRKEMNTLRKILSKISKNNPVPVDVVKETTVQEVITKYVTKAIVIGSCAFLAYKGRYLITNILMKKI